MTHIDEDMMAAIQRAEEKLLQDFEDVKEGIQPGRKYADARGVPCVGRGASSTMPGSDPLRALIAKENRGKLRLGPPDPIPPPEPYVPHVRVGKLGRRVRPEGKYF